MSVMEKNLKKNTCVCVYTKLNDFPVYLQQIHYKSTALQKVKKKKKDLQQVQMLNLNAQLKIQVIFWQFVIKLLWIKSCPRDAKKGTWHCLALEVGLFLSRNKYIFESWILFPRECFALMYDSS